MLFLMRLSRHLLWTWHYALKAKPSLTASGCSSFLFPKLMGKAKAFEMLFMGKEQSASDFKACGIVTDIFPEQDFMTR